MTNQDTKRDFSFGSSHFLLERAHELFWFCLVQVSTTQFCSFPSFLMARVTDGTVMPISPAPASSSNMGSLDGSLPDLEGTGFRASTVEEKITEIYAYSYRSSYRTRLGSKIAPKRLLRQWPPRRQRLQILNKLLGALFFGNKCSFWFQWPWFSKIFERAWTE